MKRILLCALLVPLALAAACGGATPNSREPDEYTGCATDENWRTFDDSERARVTVSDEQAPVFTAPAAGAALPFSARPTLAWKEDANDPGLADGNVLHSGPACDECCPQWNTGALSALHLPPISGDVYDLQLSVAGALDYRVLTTLQEWLPPDGLWRSFRGQTVTVKIFRMVLRTNSVKEGPFTPATPFSFSVSD